jgi:hypothetical protein
LLNKCQNPGKSLCLAQIKADFARENAFVKAKSKLISLGKMPLFGPNQSPLSPGKKPLFRPNQS